jgi:two-component system cell cycle sensor histidine kinase/response regulator CckA
VEVLTDTLVLLRPLLPASVLVSADFDRTRPLWIAGDPSQIQQVLMNLTLNARDAMPGGGVLQIDVRNEPNGDVYFEVTDTGTGMTDEVCRRITEPFFTTKTRERGTGLGMSVVHGIVTGHKGTLDIRSAIGQGTTVSVRLPGSTPPPEARILTLGVATGIAPLLARVLLVEDNKHVRKLLAAVLASNGYGVHAESDGLAALDAYHAQTNDLDLLLFDVDLPGMNGTDCLRAIRKSGGMQPALLVSGTPEFAVDPDEYGNTRFLQKPFSMERFVTVAGELLGRTG